MEVTRVREEGTLTKHAYSVVFAPLPISFWYICTSSRLREMINRKTMNMNNAKN